MCFAVIIFYENAHLLWIINKSASKYLALFQIWWLTVKEYWRLHFSCRGLLLKVSVDTICLWVNLCWGCLLCPTIPIIYLVMTCPWLTHDFHDLFMTYSKLVNDLFLKTNFKKIINMSWARHDQIVNKLTIKFEIYSSLDWKYFSWNLTGNA